MDLGKNILLILKATFELYSIVVYVLFVMNSLEISPKRLNVPSIDGRFISCASTRSWESLSDHRGDSLNCPGRLYQAGSQFHVGCLVLTYPRSFIFSMPCLENMFWHTTCWWFQLFVTCVFSCLPRESTNQRFGFRYDSNVGEPFLWDKCVFLQKHYALIYRSIHTVYVYLYLVPQNKYIEHYRTYNIYRFQLVIGVKIYR